MQNLINLFRNLLKNLLQNLSKNLFRQQQFNLIIFFLCSYINTTYAVSLNIDIDFVDNTLKIITRPNNEQDHSKIIFTHKVVNDYLIMNFAGPIDYKINNLTSRDLINKQNIVKHHFISKNKKTIFIKLAAAIKNTLIINEHKLHITIDKIKNSKITNLLAETQHKSPTDLAESTTLIPTIGSIDDKTLTLDFDYQSPIHAAGFSQNQYSWLIFDSNKKINITNLRNSKMFEDIKIFNNTQYTILRFKHPFNKSFKVYKEDNNKENNNWRVTFYRDQELEIIPSNIINELDSYKTLGRLFDLKQAGKCLKFIDELTGAELLIIPTQQSSTGVAVARNFIDYKLLRTSQGLIISKISENIISKINENDVEIISPNYMLDINNTSKISDKLRSTIRKLQEHSAQSDNSTILPFIGKMTDEFLAQYHKLLNLISNSDDSNINNLRFKLAKLYFINNMYSEAGGVLANITKHSDQYMKQQPQARFLQAVSLTLAKHYEEAETIYYNMLSDADNKANSDEINLWLNLNNFYHYNTTSKYIGFLEFKDNLIFTYPDELYWKIALADLEIAIKNNNINIANDILKNLKAVSNDNINLLDKINYLQAKKFILENKVEQAKNLLTILIKNNQDPLNQNKAQLTLLKLKLSLGESTIAETIKNIEAIKENWRGDFIEAELYMYLAKLYRDNKQPIEALKTYKYLIDSQTIKADQLFITAEMIELFNKIFSPGGANETMKDFEVVSLLYDFKELVPLGSAGNDIVSMIALRLLNLDLIDAAQALLQHQVQFRLIGEKRIFISNRLAYVYLLNGKPDLAIDIIEKTDSDNFSFVEYRRRLRIKARALCNKKLFDAALATIKNDDSTIADLVREEIFYEKKDWSNLIKLVEPDILSRISSNSEFYDTDQIEIFRLIIAYAMTGNKNKLKLLQDSLKTNNIELKKILAFFGEQKDIDYKNLSSSLDITRLEQFLASIKKEIHSPLNY